MCILYSRFDLTPSEIPPSYNIYIVKWIAKRAASNSLRSHSKRDVNQQSLHVTLMKGKLKSFKGKHRFQRSRVENIRRPHKIQKLKGLIHTKCSFSCWNYKIKSPPYRTSICFMIIPWLCREFSRRGDQDQKHTACLHGLIQFVTVIF